MATYTHYEATPPSGMFYYPESWSTAMGSSYNATVATITIVNDDTTRTIAHGSFVVINGSLVGGIVSSLDRTSSDGGILYEKIAGTAVDALAFVNATPDGKLGVALAGADTMTGYSGSDLLKGYGGADHMAGGNGDDLYVVDSANDVVTELANQGEDSVRTNLANYQLGANVEDLQFTDTGSHFGFGNGDSNRISGNTGHDILYGLGGNDTLDDGGGGSDTLIGGAGDDYYYVLAAGDTVVEQAKQGIDTIDTAVANYTLPDNVENLVLKFLGSGFGKGNALDNTIIVENGTGATVYGLDGNDTLHGNSGNDTLVGGTGNDTLVASGDSDTLTGGADDDTFVIYDGNHVITDFSSGLGVHDRIDLRGFEPNHYNINDEYLFRDFADVLTHAHQNGADTVIDLGDGNSLTLQGVQKSALVADDFVWAPTPNDFGSDTVSDILWHNDNGTVATWDDAAIDGAHILGSGVDASWHIIGSGDFDGDAHNDILWRNDNGAVSIWDRGQIDKAHIVADAGNVADSWHVAGTGDFDGNQQSDIVWRDDNGAVSIWWGGDIADAHIVANAGVVSTSWHIAGTGDFDDNGQSDILWRNDNGAVSIWDDGKIDQAHIVVPAGVVGNDWQIAGTEDFDGNGQTDILWHNSNRALSIWDNGQIGGAHVVAAAGTVSDSWHIAGVGDYDGNRQSDILWHNDNGSVSVWDDGQINGAHVVGTGIDPSWHIV